MWPSDINIRIREPKNKKGETCGKITDHCRGHWVQLSNVAFDCIIFICSECKDIKCQCGKDPVKYQKGVLTSLQILPELVELDESWDDQYYCRECARLADKIPEIFDKKFFGMGYDIKLQFEDAFSEAFSEDCKNGLLNTDHTFYNNH